MKNIKNFIFSISIMLIIPSFSGCSLHKDEKLLTLSNTIEEMPTLEEDYVEIPTEEEVSMEPSVPQNITDNYCIEEENSLDMLFPPTPSLPEEEGNYQDDRPYVALTFDDGPSAYTEELVNLLNLYDIKCTFFVVGTNCKSYSDALLIISESNHEIAIHGETHTSFTKLGSAKTNQEIINTIEYIKSLDISVSSLVRPPYGSLNSQIKENSAYPFILWNIDTEDWKTKDKEAIKSEILDNIAPGAIILMHDTKAVHKVDLEVLSEILPQLTEKYRFVTITELSEQYDTILEAGKTYRKIKIKN